MKTSLKWDQPRWLFSAFSCSLLSAELLSLLLLLDSATSPSGGDSDTASSLFSAQGGLITGLIRILFPFTTPHVSSAVMFSSLSLLSMRSTWEDKTTGEHKTNVVMSSFFNPYNLHDKTWILTLVETFSLLSNPDVSAKHNSFYWCWILFHCTWTTSQLRTYVVIVALLLPTFRGKVQKKGSTIPCWGPVLQECRGAVRDISTPQNQACCTSTCQLYPPSPRLKKKKSSHMFTACK